LAERLIRKNPPEGGFFLECVAPEVGLEPTTSSLDPVRGKVTSAYRLAGSNRRDACLWVPKSPIAEEILPSTFDDSPESLSE